VVTAPQAVNEYERASCVFAAEPVLLGQAEMVNGVGPLERVDVSMKKGVAPACRISSISGTKNFAGM